MKDKVCVVTVTYANRFHLLKQVIDASLREGVGTVIVVDNNSEPESRDKLKELEKESNGKIHVIYLPENKGSAGGYKIGLMEAYKEPDCEYIWLLDDDNVPTPGSLDALLSCWNILKEKAGQKLALLSNRKERPIYLIGILRQNPNLPIGRMNAFASFHFLDFPKKILRVLLLSFFSLVSPLKFLNKTKKLLLRRIQPQFEDLAKLVNSKNIKFGLLTVAPYGGLFFPKKIISEIGYPLEDFFTYLDDYEWTLRITRAGGRIYLCPDSIIEDISSWSIGGEKHRLSFLFESDPLRIYYLLRNSVAVDLKDRVTKQFVYNINKTIYFILVLIYAIVRKKKTRFKLVKKAVDDGIKLGRKLKNSIPY